MRRAWLDCAAGVSGDMLLAAMIDAGADPGLIEGLPALLGLEGVRVETGRTTRCGFAAARVEVVCEKEQGHRPLSAIREIIARAGGRIPARAVETADAAFGLLARAEAQAHGCGVEEVRFHETGAADAIIDITGAALLFLDLGIDELCVSPLPMPERGTVACAHGEVPLPAPALAGILEGAEVYGVKTDEERVTPTGAALVMTLADRFGPMPAMRLEGCGCGAGRREKSGPLPNVLRLFIGRDGPGADEVEVIETNIDDMTPELAAAAAQRLMDSGALDVTLTPTIMKKGRPGFILQVIARPEDGPRLRETIFRETSTIGLRYRRMSRDILPRCSGSVETRFGRIGVKRTTGPGGERITPEYEDCRRIAAERDIPPAEVYRAVRAADPQTFVREETETPNPPPDP